MNKILEPELIWNRFIEKWGKRLKIAIFTFSFGMIVYIQMVTEWLANPDGIWNGILYKTYYEWENTLGRIGLKMYNKLKGYFQFPALQTIFCLLILALITILLCEMFEIHHQIWGMLIGCLMVCSPYICDLLTYYYTADAYMLAYLFSVLFVYILSGRKRVWAFVSAVCLLVCSLSLYQAYLGTSIALCLIYLLYRLIKKGDSCKKVLVQGGYFLAGGCLGILLYLLVYRVYCIRTGIQPTDSRGFSSMGMIPKEKIFELIKSAYTFFIDYFFTNKLHFNSWHLWKQCNVLVFASIVVIIFMIQLKKKKDVPTMLLILGGLIILPLCFMSIVVFAPKASITEVTGILMLPHMNFVYLFLIVLAAGDHNGIAAVTWGKWVTVALSTYLTVILLLYVQVFQNCMRMELNRNYALAQRIVIQLEELPEYTQGMKLMVGGRSEDGNYPRSYQGWYDVVAGTVAEYGLFWDSSDGRQACWRGFLNSYLGVSYSLCSNEEAEDIISSDEYVQMPIFPEEGSVKMIGDCAVVKLSTENIYE